MCGCVVSFFNLLGATAYQHKAANLLHSISLEVGPNLIQQYCNQVVACLSDQGQRSTVHRVGSAKNSSIYQEYPCSCSLLARQRLTGTELLLGDMPSVDTARLIQDDANALELGPRAVDNAFSKDPQALAAKPRVAPFHLIACFNSVKWNSLDGHDSGWKQYTMHCQSGLSGSTTRQFFMTVWFARWQWQTLLWPTTLLKSRRYKTFHILVQNKVTNVFSKLSKLFLTLNLQREMASA